LLFLCDVHLRVVYNTSSQRAEIVAVTAGVKSSALVESCAGCKPVAFSAWSTPLNGDEVRRNAQNGTVQKAVITRVVHGDTKYVDHI